jgi:hypothetical protein
MVIQTGETPLTVTLDASNGFFRKAKYKVEASKNGYETSTTEISARVNGWYAGNILFGGVIGLLIVDPATGAMWKLDETYSVNLPSAKKVTLKSGKVVNALALNDIPLHMRGNLVRVE